MPIIALIVVLILAGGGATAAAANQAVPGDRLYGLDQAIERLQERLANTETLPALALAHSQERLEELKTLKEKIAGAKDSGNKTEEERLKEFEQRLAERLDRQIESANEKIERFKELTANSDNPHLQTRLDTMIARLESCIESREELKAKVAEGPLGKEELWQMMKAQRRALLERKQELQEEFKERMTPQASHPNGGGMNQTMMGDEMQERMKEMLGQEES